MRTLTIDPEDHTEASVNYPEAQVEHTEAQVEHTVSSGTPCAE